MAAFQPGERYSATAGADLTGKQYHIVKLNADGKVVLATAATDAILGVLDNAPVAGRTADVVLLNGAGSFKVKLAANTAKDAYITTNGSGEAVVASTEGHRVIGRLVRAGSAGAIAEYIKLNEKF